MGEERWGGEKRGGESRKRAERLRGKRKRAEKRKAVVGTKEWQKGRRQRLNEDRGMGRHKKAKRSGSEQSLASCLGFWV